MQEKHRGTYQLFFEDAYLIDAMYTQLNLHVWYFMLPMSIYVQDINKISQSIIVTLSRYQ
jgi:hypothetical protein